MDEKYLNALLDRINILEISVLFLAKLSFSNTECLSEFVKMAETYPEDREYLLARLEDFKEQRK